MSYLLLFSYYKKKPMFFFQILEVDVIDSWPRIPTFNYLMSRNIINKGNRFCVNSETATS